MKPYPQAAGAFLYHIPQVTGVPIPFNLLKQLQDVVGDKLAGVKDSSGSRANFLDLCQQFPSLRIFAGVDDLILDGLQVGAAGCITAEAIFRLLRRRLCTKPSRRVKMLSRSRIYLSKHGWFATHPLPGCAERIAYAALCRCGLGRSSATADFTGC